MWRISLALTFLCCSVSAQTTTEWRPLNGPYGFTPFAVHAIDSSGNFWGAGFGRLFRSVDDGRSWRKTDTIARPRAVSVSPTGRVLVSTEDDGLWYSDDRGEAWVKLPGSPTAGSTHTAMLVHSDGAIYVSTHESWTGVLFRTTDGGKVWDRLGSLGGGIATPNHWSALMSIGPDVVILTQDRSFIIRAETQGVLEERPFSHAPTSSSHAGSSIVITVGDSLLRSTDAGVTWNRLMSFGPGGALSVSLIDERTAVVSAASGLYRTEDAGETWTIVLPVKAKEPTLVRSGSTGTILFSDEFRSYRSDDDGRTWRTNFDGLVGIRINAMFEHSVGTLVMTGDRVVASTSTDGGESWRSYKHEGDVGWFDGTDVSSVDAGYDITELPSGRIILETKRGLLISDDGGLTWGEPYGSNAVPYDLEYGDGVMLASIRDQHLRSLGRSIDSGQTWTILPTEVELGSIHWMPTRHSFIASDIGNWEWHESFDNGQTWSRRFRTPYSTISIDVDPSDGEIFTVDRKNGLSEFGFDISRSIDAGESWQSIRYNIDSMETVSAFAVAPDGDLFLNMRNGALYRLPDGFTQWERLIAPGAGKAMDLLLPLRDGRVIGQLRFDGLFVTVTTTITDTVEGPSLQPASGIAVYPNPTAGSITIAMGEGDQPIGLLLSSLRGGELPTGPMEEAGVPGQWTASLPDLPDGLYFVVVRLADGRRMNVPLRISGE